MSESKKHLRAYRHTILQEYYGKKKIVLSSGTFHDLKVRSFMDMGEEADS